MVEQHAAASDIGLPPIVQSGPGRWQQLKDWWAQSTARRVVTGMKSLLVAGFGVALGLADYVDQIDLSGLLQGVFGDNVKVGAIITVCFTVMMVMRLISKGAAFAGLRAPNDGE